jgi:primosomal protein N' (replication factor Y)
VNAVARVVAESNLIQLDREFDFLVPDHLRSAIKVGQRVKFEIGRSKKTHTGFVTELAAHSQYATSELLEIVSETEVLTPEIYSFARQIADRQSVAIGEILALAIPDHMPRISVQATQEAEFSSNPFSLPKLDKPLGQRSAVLSAARNLMFETERFPDWALLFAFQAVEGLLAGKSSILIVPEQSQLRVLKRLFVLAGLAEKVVEFGPGQKKSERFQMFHRALLPIATIAIGTRSAIYAPVHNLGLVALFDDLDDSLKEQGSPFTHARELALMRSSERSLVLAANYRSVEVQRLVEIGYLTDHTLLSAPARIAFSEPSLRMDRTSFELIRERVEAGPILVLLPRKGSSPAAFCSGCGDKLRCKNCGGPIWEPTSGTYACKLCRIGFSSCQACGASKAKSGRAGSSRTVSELGKAFPQVLISESTAEKQPSKILANRHIIVSTPGASPVAPNGYSAVLILDCDIWLSSQSLQAEQLAIRDWMEAIELMADDGRAVIAGIPTALGQAITLGQHRQLAKVALQDLQSLNLPPAARVAWLQASTEVLLAVLEELKGLGAQEIRTELGEQASSLIRFSYQNGQQISAALRRHALKANARLVGANKRRGLRIAMDDWSSL